MYTEEPRRRIDWGNVLRKIIILVIIILIIFLIVWLFNRSNRTNNLNTKYNNNSNTTINNSNNNNNEYNNNETNNSGLQNPNLYSESFIINYSYFHDTARDFVEKNNLPIENNSVKYTLQELINKNLLLPTSYNNGTCDSENSYVIVTNDNGKYTMTTTLICGNEIAKTSEELKCSGLCTNCNKEEEEVCTDKDCNTKLEYEFKQAYNATETVYTCPSGYTKTGSGNSTKCVKSNNNVVNPTKNVTYSCPTGYTKTGMGDTTKCVKGVSETIDATPTKTYSCASYGSNYKLSGNKCIKYSSDSKDAELTTTYSCSKYGSDYKLSGNKCIKTITDTKDAKTVTTYSCSNGATPNSEHKCPTTTTSYKCTTGELVNTSYCRVYTTGAYYQQYNIYYGQTYNGCTYSGSSTTPCTTCAGSTRTVYNYYCKYSS